MRAAVFAQPGKIKVADRPDPKIVQPTDAVVRVALACVCGSDMWFYRGQTPYEAGRPVGHEFIAVVEETGAEVRALHRGDAVIAPFAYSDGTCPHCQAGITTSCRHGGFWAYDGMDGGQGEAVRVPFADATLVAVGLSGVLAAARIGADRIIALSRHEDRQRLARDFGATDIVAERGE